MAACSLSPGSLGEGGGLGVRQSRSGRRRPEGRGAYSSVPIQPLALPAPRSPAGA